ncbi:MAG: translocation/assembly module TamB, partial [Pseudoxanthomonas sp.]
MNRRPDDLTPEEREARIAELRARRRARVRKLAMRSAIGVGVLVVGLLVALYWLLQTVAGRDVLLAQITARLPAGSTFTYASAEGPVAGPLTLRDVHFHLDNIDFTARRITLDPDLRPLLGKRLRLDKLEVEDAVLDMPPSPDEPFELPRWPDVLPQIELPLNIQADTLVVDGFRYTSAGETVIDVSSARGGIDLGDGYAEATAVKLRSNLGNFSVDGHYRPGDKFETDLTVSAGFPAPRGRTPARLGLVARGDVRHMEIAVGGNAPAPVKIHVDVRGATKPDWALRAVSTRLDLSLFGVGATDAPPLAFDLQASGTDGGAAISGQAKQGDNLVVIEPSHVRIDGTTLTVQPLAVQLLGGRITRRGHADFAETENPRFKFAV